MSRCISTSLIGLPRIRALPAVGKIDRKSTRLNSSHSKISYAVFCLKKKKASANGEVEICNAGHCFPLILQSGEIKPIAATGLPVGVFRQENYSATQMQLGKGDRLLLYTDGLSEARDETNTEYGDKRLHLTLAESHDLRAGDLV